MKIAVTGAFSYSGKYIAKRLLARGEEVITLTNHPNRPNPFAGKIPAFPLNFEKPAELENNLRGVDVLVNTPTGCGLTKAATPNPKPWKIQKRW